MKYNIELDDRELQFVLDCIAEEPYKVVKNLMDKFTSQITLQQNVRGEEREDRGEGAVESIENGN